MLTIYQSADESFVNRQAGEESESVAWTETPPTIGDTITMGSDRPWTIAAIETYSRFDDSLIHLAYVAPAGEEPSIEAIDPSTSFYILVEGRTILTWGWRMDGTPPTGIVENYEPVPGHPTLLHTTTPEWEIVSTRSYSPTQPGSYSKVYICECRKLAVAA